MPTTLYTSAAQESVIADHLPIFEMNGFKLQVDDHAPCGQRIKLVSVPFSKSVQFGPDDVNELASMLSDGYADFFFDGKDSKHYLLLNNQSLVPAVGARLAAEDSSVPSKQRIARLLLPKLMSMFASRACRSAVMIGTALKSNEMKSIVSQLQHIEQPWNCPHGRPTMRHLFDLQSLSK